MIIDLEKFVKREKATWEELEAILDRLEKDHAATMSMDEVKRFHYLYERVSSDLSSVSSLSTEQGIRTYLESLVVRAYGEIHETRAMPHSFRPFRWFFVAFPRTFRMHLRAFQLATAVVLLGCLFGGIALALDPSSKEVFVPFDNLMSDPRHRVNAEERAITDRLEGMKTRGAAWYMANNTRVAFTTMALGATWGIGTVLLLFSTGVMIGSIGVDYVMAGQMRFLLGWLLPHGSVEIPAILIAGQAGFMLAGSMIGWGKRISMKERLRSISDDLVTLIFGVALLLVWAGFVEAFLSQYHEPTLPYSLKIAFGCVQLALLILFLARSGRSVDAAKEDHKPKGSFRT